MSEMSPELSQGELAQSDDDIINECQTRYTFSQEAEGRNRSEYEFDKRFVGGDQWDPTIRDERFSDRRPCLTINITDAMCRRIVNACRENRPRIVVHPVGDGADVQTADVIDGLIRHIEYSSNAPYAYDTAVENAIHGGWGWLSIDADYDSEDSFDQNLIIGAWPNPLMCYADPNTRAPDGSDMDWFIETKFLKRTEYRAQYGKLDPEGWRWVGRGDDVPDWSNKEEIRIAKYWRVERYTDTLYKLSDGRTAFSKEMMSQEGQQILGVSIVAKRPVVRKRVTVRILTAKKILDTREWPGKWIPRVPVYGRRLDLNGRMELKGMVRDLRDIARMYNYAQTAKTEQYALQPKAPWVGPEGFMDGHEAAWRDANRKPIVALEYKIQQDPTNGATLPPPERSEPPKPAVGFVEWGDSTKTDFLAVAGMAHDPGQDKEGEVISGIALKKRAGLADISNFDFYDNLTRSLCQLGRIIVDLIPHYYDTHRMIRIVREDGTAEQVQINQPVADHIKNDLTVGKYEVVVDTGPSYQTKREQSAEAMLELLGTPGGEMVAQTSMDLIVRAMDFPNADSVANRLIAAIPAAQMDKNSDLPPKAQAIISGLQQQLANANKAQLALHLELQSKHQLEQMKQAGETHRVVIKEENANERERMKTHTAMHDTHVKAVTAHDVAEINTAGKILDTHATAAHERERVKDELAQAASKRSE